MSVGHLRVGISPCPNDTFAFHALLQGVVRPDGLELEIVLADIEQLNRRLAEGALDVAKASYHMALAHAAQVYALPVGSALGFGVGPLLVAAPGFDPTPAGATPPRVLLPGQHTTAALLWSLYGREHVGAHEVRHVRFSEILPLLARGEAELGVCIHEGRFMWREHGLHELDDLGARFEARAGSPLPLGGLFASRSVDRGAAARLAAALRASLEWAWANRQQTLPTMRRHAQELSDEVLWQHVDLYVNDWTLELGSVGRRAIEVLRHEALRASALPEGSAALEVLAV